MNWTLVICLALCTACSGADKAGTDTGILSGSAVACLSSAADTGANQLAIAASVVSDVSGRGCDGAVGRTLTVTDSASNTWTLGYAFVDDEGLDITLALDLDAHDEVTLLVRRSDGPTGFVLSDAVSVVGALESGDGGNALQDGDVSGLTVSQGELLSRANTPCGQLASYGLIFRGDADIPIEPFDKRLITASGQAYAAYALRSTGYEGESTCDPEAAGVSWAVWRPPT